MRSRTKQHKSLIIVLVLCLHSFAFAQQTQKDAGLPKIEELIGKWRGGRKGDSDVITIKFKDEKRSKLVLEGKYDDWEGSYANGSLVFTRRPKAAEMHDSAPAWAREIAAQDNANPLKWALELLPSRECGQRVLKGNWFRGELEWEETKDPKTNEAKRSAKNTGLKGDPIAVEYSLAELITERSKEPAADINHMPDGVEKARKAYLTAKENEAKSKKSAAAAQQAADDIAAKMTAELEANVGQYRAVAEEIESVRQEVLKKYEERAKAAVVPASLIDEYLEYKRQYKILSEYRQYVEDSFFLGIKTKIDTLNSKLQDAQKNADQKVTEIDQQIAKLKMRKEALDKRLAEITPLPVNDKLFGELITALYEAGKSRRTAFDAESEAAAAFDKYTEAMKKTTPPYLKSTAVFADGQKVYAADWSVKQNDDKVGNNQNAIDLEASRLRELVKRLDADIADMDKELKENAATRLEMAERMQPFSKTMMEAAEAEQNAAYKKIAAQIVIESAAVVLEVALTGGVATAARKAGELAAEESAKRVILMKAKNKVRNVASQMGTDLALDFEKVANNATQRIFEQEFKKIERVMAEELARKRLAAIQKARSTGGEAAARRVSNEFDDMLHAVTREQMEAAKLKAFQKDGADYVGTLAQWVGNEGAAQKALSADTSKLAAAGAMALEGQKVIDTFELSPVDNQWKAVVTGDALELAFQRGIKFAALQGEESLEAAAGKLASSGSTRWQQFKAGSKAFFGSKVNYANFKEAFKPDPTLLISAAATVGKAAAVAYFVGKEQEARARFLTAYTELETRYQVYYTSLCIDQKIWELQQDYRRQRAQALGRLAELGRPRELKVTTNLTAGPEACLKVELRFSTFLDKQPIVTLGNEVLSLAPDGPAESADRWVGSVSAKRLAADTAATLRVVLGSGNKPFGFLDADPATPAYISVSDNRWTGYDAGGDENHKIKIGK